MGWVEVQQACGVSSAIGLAACADACSVGLPACVNYSGHGYRGICGSTGIHSCLSIQASGADRADCALCVQLLKKQHGQQHRSKPEGGRHQSLSLRTSCQNQTWLLSSLSP